MQPQGLRAHLRGISLIELMIGMALSLLTVIAIYQVLTVWDSRRRTITTNSSAQISGGIAIAEIERDLQLSGMGFGNASALTIGCSVNAYNNTFATPAFSYVFTPVQIVDGGVGGAPDVVRVLSGDSAYVVNIQKVNASTNTNKTLQYRAGFNAGDVVVVSGNTPRDCSQYEVTGNLLTDAVTILHNNANYTNFYTAASVPARLNPTTPAVLYTGGAEIYNLGPGAQRTEWAVSTANVLTRRNTLFDDVDKAFEVTDGIVNLQAQYGVDGSGPGARAGVLNGRIDDDEWSTTQPTDWTKLLAVRIAVLARGSQMESTVVTPTAPVWAGGSFVMLNLDGSAGTAAVASNDWRHYRYRVYETMVPLRNMIWGSTS